MSKISRKTGGTVKNILKLLSIVIGALLALLLPTSAKAEFIFSDTFQNGYNSIWHVPTGAVSPTSSPFGITGENSTAWSVIQTPLSQDGIYEIQFDILINKESSSHAWGIGIGDDLNNWKIINTWQTSLQIHESIGIDKLITWNNSLGVHHFIIRISPKDNSKVEIYQDNQQLIAVTTTSSFNISRIWLSLQGYGDYELANFSLSTYDVPTITPTPEPTLTPTPTPTSTLIPTQTPTPSPTPTSTPSPTQTPTPTSTPNTPTPQPNKKVVFLHGMGGSWNADALLNCKSSGYSGSWSPWTYKNFDMYSPLLTAFKNSGYQIFPYYYDWRQTTKNTAQKLKKYIEIKTSTNESFNLVGHSFGGLVGREYINIVRDQNEIDKFLTIGTPHLGSVFAYPAWAGGEMWLESTEMRLGFTIMKIGCSMKHNMSAREMVRSIIPSIQNLLPLFNYLQTENSQMKPTASMKSKNNWLPDSFSTPYYGIDVRTIAGTGYSTLKTLEVRSPSRQDVRSGNWIDGQPTKNITYGDGDGTVLSESSILPNTSNISLPLDHSGLVTNQAGIDAILNILSGENSPQPLQGLRSPQKNTVTVKNATILFIATEDGHFSLTDKDGNKIQDSEGQITILDPKEETYTLSITPTKRWWWHKTRVVVVQLFDDGTSKWKEYTHMGGTHRHWKLHFDRKHRSDDILRDK